MRFFILSGHFNKLFDIWTVAKLSFGSKQCKLFDFAKASSAAEGFFVWLVVFTFLFFTEGKTDQLIIFNSNSLWTELALLFSSITATWQIMCKGLPLISNTSCTQKHYLPNNAAQIWTTVLSETIAPFFKLFICWRLLLAPGGELLQRVMHQQPCWAKRWVSQALKGSCRVTISAHSDHPGNGRQKMS